MRGDWAMTLLKTCGVLTLAIGVAACRPAAEQQSASSLSGSATPIDAPEGGAHSLLLDAPEVHAGALASVTIGTAPSSDKIEICHRTGASSITLSVSPSALDEHLAHGDNLDACGAAVPDGDTLLIQWREGATAVALLTVVSMESRTITALPKVVMDVTVTPIQTF